MRSSKKTLDANATLGLRRFTQILRNATMRRQMTSDIDMSEDEDDDDPMQSKKILL